MSAANQVVIIQLMYVVSNDIIEYSDDLWVAAIRVPIRHVQRVSLLQSVTRGVTQDDFLQHLKRLIERSTYE